MDAVAPKSSLNLVRGSVSDPWPVPGLIGDIFKRLDRIGKRIKFSRGQVIYREGDPAPSFYIVHQGKVKLSLASRDGRTIVVRFAGQDEFLGLSEVLLHMPYALAAEAMEPTVVKRVHHADFLALQREHGEINAIAAQALAREYSELITHVHHWAQTGRTSGRLARLLLERARANGSAEPQTRLYVGHMTHYEIADMVGSSRETVTRILKRFEREGLISRRGASLEILNEAALKLKTG